jgi:sarcosine oxidase gamma subunit
MTTDTLLSLRDEIHDRLDDHHREQRRKSESNTEQLRNERLATAAEARRRHALAIHEHAVSLKRQRPSMPSELVTAVAGVLAQPQEPRKALTVLRRTALRYGDDEWAVYARQRLKELRPAGSAGPATTIQVGEEVAS